MTGDGRRTPFARRWRLADTKSASRAACPRTFGSTHGLDSSSARRANSPNRRLTESGDTPSRSAAAATVAGGRYSTCSCTVARRRISISHPWSPGRTPLDGRPRWLNLPSDVLRDLSTTRPLARSRAVHVWWRCWLRWPRHREPWRNRVLVNRQLKRSGARRHQPAASLRGASLDRHLDAQTLRHGHQQLDEHRSGSSRGRHDGGVGEAPDRGRAPRCRGLRDWPAPDVPDQAVVLEAVPRGVLQHVVRGLAFGQVSHLKAVALEGSLEGPPEAGRAQEVRLRQPETLDVAQRTPRSRSLRRRSGTSIARAASAWLRPAASRSRRNRRPTELRGLVDGARVTGKAVVLAVSSAGESSSRSLAA